MMQRVFLDTNILLDMLLERHGFEYPAEILQMHEKGELTACQSSLSLTNIAYVLRKEFSRQLLISTINQLCSVTEVLPVDDSMVRDATMLDGPDFEDLVQTVCAVRGNCPVIITRNIKDFRISKGLLKDFPTPAVMTPEAFLSMHQDLSISTDL